jgi:predicted P-loop ATPase
MQTRGVWIIALSELDNLSHAEVSRIKAFMSRTTDRFRPPYGMRLVESPRQRVFTWYRQPWHVTCATKPEVAGSGRWSVGGLMSMVWPGVRDQLWAEAKARFESGSVWWLDTPDLVQLASD